MTVAATPRRRSNLGARLVRQGHQVRLVGWHTMASRAAAAGIEFANYPSVSPWPPELASFDPPAASSKSRPPRTGPRHRSTSPPQNLSSPAAPSPSTGCTGSSTWCTPGLSGARPPAHPSPCDHISGLLRSSPSPMRRSTSICRALRGSDRRVRPCLLVRIAWLRSRCACRRSKPLTARQGACRWSRLERAWPRTRRRRGRGSGGAISYEYVTTTASCRRLNACQLTRHIARPS